MRYIRFGFAAGLALLYVMLTAGTAQAVEPWRIAVRIQGHVESQEPGQGSWSPIFRSRRLSDGSLARTLDNSIAAINLADQSTFRIGPNSEVEMTKFQLTPEGRTVVFNLRFGKVQADVAKLLGGKSRFEVRTPNGVLAARGTEFSVTEVPASSVPGLQKQLSQASIGNVDGVPMLAAATGTVTLVSVFEGTVDSQSNGSKVITQLRPGDNAIVGAGFTFVNPANFPAPQMIPPGQKTFKGFQSQQMQQQANTYQDAGHQTQADVQYSKQVTQYNSVVSDNLSGLPAPAPVFTSTITNITPGATTINVLTGGTSNVVAPPLFTPANTVNPLTNTLNSTNPLSGGENSFGGNFSSPGGGTTTVAPTGRLIIIIK